MSNIKNGDLPANPMQPLQVIKGIIRFKENKIVSDILDSCRELGGLDLNKIAASSKYSQDDRIQLAQLIGYSLGGYVDLSFVDAKSADKAMKASGALLNELDNES